MRDSGEMYFQLFVKKKMYMLSQSDKNSIGHRPLWSRCPSNHLTPTNTHLGATGNAFATIYFFGVFERFERFVRFERFEQFELTAPAQMPQVTFSITAPTHPHMTRVAD